MSLGAASSCGPPRGVVAKSVEGPAFYATGQRSAWRDVRASSTAYTAWHLSYVVLAR